MSVKKVHENQPKEFKFSEENLKKVEQILKKYQNIIMTKKEYELSLECSKLKGIIETINATPTIINNVQYNSANNLIRDLKLQNITEVTLEAVLELNSKIDNLSILLFDDCKGDVDNCIERLLILLDKIRNVFDKNNNKLMSEYSIRFYELIEKKEDYKLHFHLNSLNVTLFNPGTINE